MPLKIDDTNYDKYELIFRIIWSHYSTLLPPLTPALDPLQVLLEWKKKNKRYVKSGLKAALMDIIIQFKHLPPDLLKKIDSDLTKNDLPNTRALQAIATNAVSKILKRQQIKTIDELYIAKEYVCEFDSDISEEDRTLLDKYMGEFESTIRK